MTALQVLGFGIPLLPGIRYFTFMPLVIIPGIVPMPHHRRYTGPLLGRLTISSALVSRFYPVLFLLLSCS